MPNPVEPVWAMNDTYDENDRSIVIYLRGIGAINPFFTKSVLRYEEFKSTLKKCMNGDYKDKPWIDFDDGFVFNPNEVVAFTTFKRQPPQNQLQSPKEYLEMLKAQTKFMEKAVEQMNKEDEGDNWKDQPDEEDDE